LGVSEDNAYAKQFLMLAYVDGSFSTVPHRFFRDWLDEETQFGSFYIGRGSGPGVGSLVKYDSNAQNLGLCNAPPQYAHSIIKNDVWLGHELMMLGGGIIENGCVIGARSFYGLISAPNRMAFTPTRQRA